MLAAQCSCSWWYSWLISLVFIYIWNGCCQVTNNYSRLDLIKIGLSYEQKITAKFPNTHNITEEIACHPGSPWITIHARKT